LFIRHRRRPKPRRRFQASLRDVPTETQLSCYHIENIAIAFSCRFEHNLSCASFVLADGGSIKRMRVTIFTRHSADCDHRDDRNYTRCSCAKHLEWFDGKQHRQSAKTRDVREAEKQAREIESEHEAIARGEQPKQKTTGGKGLEEAIDIFLASKKSHVTDKHLDKLRYELGEFRSFCDGKNLMALVSIQTENVLDWRNRLVGAQNTRAKKVFRLVGFFEFCVEMGWISRNVARAKAITIKYDDSQEPKALTDEQFNQAFSSIPRVNGRTTDEQRTKLRSLVLLMRWTGLAIRDAVTVKREWFEKNGEGFYRLRLRRAKTGHPVDCPIRTDIMEQIFAGGNKGGKYLFVDSVPDASTPSGEKALDALVGDWGYLFGKLSDAANLTDENGEAFKFGSHAMRHTFVYWCLQNEITTEDIAMLIGDTLAVVAKHYSGWIAGRQERLSQRMKAALSA
jgi:integrase/recombinase XerD